jgi:diacylglycerol kinase family enzyme
VIVVFNPAAGRRRAARLWRVLDVLTHAGVRLTVAETQRPGHARDLAAEAARAGARLVVAAGGDGTIAEVANGLNGAATPLGVIPLGTANVLANEFRLPFAPRAVAAALSFRRTQPLWPGIGRRPDGSETLFVQMVGAGFDAQVVHNLSLGLKRAIGKGAYVWQTLRELPRYPYAPIRLRVDGTPTTAASVIVTKGRLYAGRYTVAPDARPDQPGFRVVLFDRTGPLAALAYGAALPLNLIPRVPGVRILHARHVEIEDAAPLQADGDDAGTGPIEIVSAPQPIAVVGGG